jgi:hypothetical protein
MPQLIHPFSKFAADFTSLTPPLKSIKLPGDVLIAITASGAKLEPNNTANEDVYVFFKSDESSSTLKDPFITALQTYFCAKKLSFNSAVVGFEENFNSLRNSSEETLSGFEGALDALKNLRVSWQPETTTVYSLLPIERLREFKIEFEKQLKELNAKVLDWKKKCAIEVENSDILATLKNLRGLEVTGTLLEEGMQRVKKALVQLQHPAKLPLACEKVSLEISRRKQYREKLKQKADAIRKEFEQMQTEENEKRRRWFSKYGCHLPVNLVPGLGDFVPSMDIRIPIFDKDLPDIGTEPSGRDSSSSVMDMSVAMKIHFPD